MKGVARHASVALGTVSKYLNTPERVSPAMQARIRAAIDELGYTRNEAARQLKSGRSRTLTLVALELNNPFFGEVAEAMERRATEDDLFLSIVSANGDAEREAEYIRLLVQQRVYGVILASGHTQTSELDLLHSTDTPTVLMDAYPDVDRFSSCSVDDFTGAKHAVSHLVQQGCQRITFVGGEMKTHQIAQRLRGAQSAIAESSGVKMEIIATNDRSVTAGISAGDDISRRRKAERPDGIFAANDSLAIGIIESFVRTGTVLVPDDIAVIGYDDVDFAAASAVPLSSVRRPRVEFGRGAVDLVTEQARAATRTAVRHTIIQPELVVRHSSTRTG
ncbi:LacI family DNA-binding transcriptional regulator [Microbacterium gubbeenense]|uniref:LacI family DNA-binding transcriptional regulator n=1 Tax=Microbacterium gubbeenense TaxID=159896 RepID=UPI00056657AB|nr:LacI family DNA-binding transcriptional regulator [Microbacterium gubbeenense]